MIEIQTYRIGVQLMKKYLGLLFVSTIVFGCVESENEFWFKNNSNIKISQKGNVSIYYSENGGLLNDSLFILRGGDSLIMKQVWNDGLLKETYIVSGDNELVKVNYCQLNEDVKGYRTADGDEFFTLYSPSIDSFFVDHAKVNVVRNINDLDIIVQNTPMETYELMMPKTRLYHISANHFRGVLQNTDEIEVWLSSIRSSFKILKLKK